MNQNVHMKLNPGLASQKRHSKRRDFRHEVSLNFKEKITELLHLENRFV
jgi:hypothetical protein